MSLNGCAKSVVLKKNNSYVLDEKILQEILLKPEIKDLPVVVVSVAGPWRSGKSFLLNFFLRYLSSEKTAQEDGSWIGARDASLTGFDWRGGVSRVTSGIQLWSEPFIATLDSGEQVTVLLMDTQGIPDSFDRNVDNRTIFTLSTLISSVQIYNLMGNFKEDDLQNLQLFTMSGNLIREESNTGKFFQNLVILIRDWGYSDYYPYGVAGGKPYLESQLQVISNMPEESRKARNHLRSSFEEVFCFLMPHLGISCMKPGFRGNIEDIDLNFKDNLIKLVPSILKTENLSPKIINGQKIIARELYIYFRNYMSLLSNNDILNPIQATVEVNLRSAVKEAQELYKKQMSDECDPAAYIKPAGHIQELDRKYRDKAREYFISKTILASKTKIDEHLANLMEYLDDALQHFKLINLVKQDETMNNANEAYENVINNINNCQPLCLHPRDLETIHEEAVKSAMAFYDARVTAISGSQDLKRNKLVESFQNRCENLIMINDSNNKHVVKDLFEEYRNKMNTHFKDPPLSQAEFKAGHEEALQQSMAKFETKRNRRSEYPDDVYKCELEKIIMDEFSKLETFNNGKVKPEIAKSSKKKARRKKKQTKIEKIQTADTTVLQKALREARQVYENQISGECDRATTTVPAADIQELHRKYLDIAREAFSNKRTTAIQTEVNRQLYKLTKATIEDLHKKCLSIAKTAFTSKSALEAETEANNHLYNLIKDLDEKLPQLAKNNQSNLQAITEQANKVYETTINNINKDQPLCLHPRDLETCHDEAVVAAMTLYDGQVKPISDEPDPNREELIQGFQNRYVQLTTINDTNNKNLIENIFVEYQNIMDTHTKDHEEALKQSIEKFETKRNRLSRYPNDIYKDELKKTIMDALSQLQTIDPSKVRQDTTKPGGFVISRYKKKYKKAKKKLAKGSPSK